jgi:uncharacterized protein (TIGR03437 family)
VGGTPPAGQTITLSSTDSSTVISYNVTFATNNGGNSWLFASPPAASTASGQNTVTVLVNPGLLSAGQYTGTITITASGATVPNSPLTIPVIFNVTAGTITLNPTTLSFAQSTGGSAPAAQTVQVTSNGSPLSFSAAASVSSGTVNWLSVASGSGGSTATGTTPGSLSVSVDGSKLNPGTYTGTITVTAPNANAATIGVTLTVNAGTLGTTPTDLPTNGLVFTQTAGLAAPAAQTFGVTGTPGVLTFNVTTSTSTGAGWFSAAVTTLPAQSSTSTGNTPATVSVTVNGGSLTPGTYKGTVTITSPGAAGSPINVPITLNVVPGVTLNITPASPYSFNYTIGLSTGNTLSQAVSLTSSGSTAFTATAATKDGANWLSVSPASGTATTTATTVTVTANPQGLLTAGIYSGTVTITSANAVNPVTITVNLTVVAIPAPVITGVKNSASYSAAAVSPGELIAVFGTNVGPLTQAYGAVSGGKLSSNVSGFQVLFDGTPAPIYYALATQTAVFVPYEVAGRATTVITVVNQGVVSNALTYNVTAAVPGIFTQNSQGSGPGSILNQDYTVNGPTNGESAGRIIQIFMTGEGQTAQGGVTGAVVPSNGTGLKTPVLPVTGTIGGVAVTGSAVVYAGSAPGDVEGIMQVDLVIPAGLTPGPQPIVINVGSNSTQTGVTVQVK